jgi:hypothetical protein
MTDHECGPDCAMCRYATLGMLMGQACIEEEDVEILEIDVTSFDGKVVRRYPAKKRKR